MHPALIMEEEESHMPALGEELIVNTNYVNIPEKNGARTQQRLKEGRANVQVQNYTHEDQRMEMSHNHARKVEINGK